MKREKDSLLTRVPSGIYAVSMEQVLINDSGLRYTYRDYRAWDKKEAGGYELIDGNIYPTGSPTQAHQRLSKIIFRQFEAYLAGKPGEAFYAPFDVRLFPQEDDLDTTVVQPDIFVVCDASKLEEEGTVKGAPDLVIEIVSPGSRALDLYAKKEQYFQAGVPEYWIILSPRKICTYRRADTVYRETQYAAKKGVLKVPVGIFHDRFIISLAAEEVFR